MSAQGASFSFDQFLKAKDLKDKIYFTFLALIVYRIGAFVPLPGINPTVISDLIQSQTVGMLGVLDMFSGGALSRMTIFALNIMPYISSSIIVQLLSTLYPPLQHLRKEGEIGRKKLNRYTRFLTVGLAFLQGLGIALMIEKFGTTGGENPAILVNVWLFRISSILTLMGGVLFLMWIGEQISSRGIGNGISLIIYAGIVASLPNSLLRVFTIGREEGVYYIVPLILIGAFVTFAYVVFMEKAQFKVPIQYPKRSMQQAGKDALPSHMPLKVNMAGVMPPIFAQSIISLPLMLIAHVFTNYNFSNYLMALIRPGHPVYMTVFALLIIFFSFFYTQLMFNADETADNLKKSQAYIPGIRPGSQTSSYLKTLLYRLSVIGAVYLVTVCLIPQYLISKTSLPFYIGGTTILIIVSVTIETITQIQSHLFAHQYKGLVSSRMSKRRGR